MYPNRHPLGTIYSCYFFNKNILFGIYFGIVLKYLIYLQIASRPGAHKLRCLFRVAFVPASAAALAQKDLHALDYLYTQCCNDVIQERFAPELQYDTALRLAALHIYQHALAHNVQASKLTVKTVE